MGILAAVPRRPDAEVTVECNPDTVTPELLAAYRAGGVTRLSFGVQSMAPHVLAALGRTHDPAGVERAVAAARDAGFDNFNLDLIYGGAGETAWPTGGPPWTRRWPSTRPTSAPTPSPSSPAPRWPGASTPATSPRPTTTTRPRSTWPPTPP